MMNESSMIREEETKEAMAPESRFVVKLIISEKLSRSNRRL
jgi:hypothetical protein